MQKITPFLWFNNNVEEAFNFYVSVFKNSRIVSVRRSGKGWPGGEGKVFTGTIEIEGQEFMALNGGPMYSFTPAISFFIKCETQAEVDDLWDKLSEGGTPQKCGWLTDKFGVSWQVIPNLLGEYLGDKDPEKVKRVMNAMMQMVKIDVEGLKRAYEGEN
jgi:predicted 3-demethylubiquinone-9 3-methyltransferase (glyoxalase superfamily)